MSSKQLEENDSQCPYISFQSILISSQRFRSHVEGRAHIILRGLGRILHLDGKSKICDLKFSIFGGEDVGRFEVSMYDIFLCEVEVSPDDLVHVAAGFILAHLMFDEFVEIGVAEFGDDVGIVFGGEDLVDVEDVLLIFEFFEDGDFALEEDPVDLVLEHFHVDDLDGNFLVGFVLTACVDLAGVALADDVG